MSAKPVVSMHLFSPVLTQPALRSPAGKPPGDIQPAPCEDILVPALPNWCPAYQHHWSLVRHLGDKNVAWPSAMQTYVHPRHFYGNNMQFAVE